MGIDTVSPLRQRMIEDMNARKLCTGTGGRIRSCKRFAAFLKCPQRLLGLTLFGRWFTTNWPKTIRIASDYWPDRMVAFRGAGFDLEWAGCGAGFGRGKRTVKASRFRPDNVKWRDSGIGGKQRSRQRPQQRTCASAGSSSCN